MEKKTAIRTSKWLSVGIATMGVLHMAATFSPVIAGKLTPLNEAGQRAFTYMSLMCGALLVLGGTLSVMFVGRMAEHQFLRKPYLFIKTILLIDGFLATACMPHNPCVWVICILSVFLMANYFYLKE